jgi:hypothetical protein
MYSIILTTENNNNFYNIKMNLSKKDYYINLYNLENKGLYKSFYKNNILIISNSTNTDFYKIKEKEISFKDNYLFIETEKTITEPFVIFDTDYEEVYTLYTNKIYDILINLRIYEKYFELEYITDDLNKFNKLEK